METPTLALSLRTENFFTGQADTQTAQTQSGVLFLLQTHVADLLVSADVQGPDHHRPVAHDLSYLLIGFVQFILRRQGISAQIQKLTAHQTNTFRIRFSPSLPCLIVLTLCITPDIQPLSYAWGRIWDTAIGLTVGMAVNTLIFPYDNSRRIRSLIRSLDQDVLRFLEEVFDGDEVLPDPESLRRKLRDMEDQLAIFSNQKLLLHLRRQKADLERYHLCGEKARELTARLQILSLAGKPGRLNDENRQKLKHAGADIRDQRPLKNPQERDIVTNYHVRQILQLRQEILDILENKEKVQ